MVTTKVLAILTAFYDVVGNNPDTDELDEAVMEALACLECIVATTPHDLHHVQLGRQVVNGEHHRLHRPRPRPSRN